MNYKSSVRLRFSPLWVILLLVISYAAYNSLFVRSTNTLVQSDGRGYYAYLPAFVTYADPDFSKTVKAEKKYHEQEFDPYYLHKTADDKIYNKYFPGVAVLQLPFYLIATFLALLFQFPADGYSPVYMICYFIGSTFYACSAVLLIYRLYRKMFPQISAVRLELTMCLVLLAGPVIYYGFITFYYSQVHSLFVFACCATAFYSYAETGRKRALYLFALSVGLIFIIRPTNILFLSFLPALLPDKEKLKNVLKSIFGNWKTHLFPCMLIFLSVGFILFLSWKWQTGKWFVWNYNGEGFNFLHPELWSSLFSFRTGLFLQIPLMLLVIAGVWFLYRQSSYRTFWWSLYFVLNIYIISAWWCWDFESQFSIRPLTEHFFFLALPLIAWLGSASGRSARLSFVLAVLFAVVNLIRLSELQTGFMTDQRFTSSNYLESLAFWKKENKGRWNFTLSCKPFGRITAQKTVIEQHGEEEIMPNEEFALTGTVSLKDINRGRLYYNISLKKKMISEDMKGLYVVLDVTGKNGRRYYRAIDMFNDLQEGKGEFKELVFEGLIPDNFHEMEGAAIYIWNMDKNHVVIKDLKGVIENYEK